MLQFLITSKARRRLLLLLWAEKARGSVGELAERAGVGFASAHRELKAMRRFRLATSVRDSGKEVYRANEDHPDADLLRRLATSSRLSESPAMSRRSMEVRRRLKALGAPLNVEPADESEAIDVETTLVNGVKLARRDPSVARTLPICFWLARDSLEWKDFANKVRGAENKHAVGFFLELTGELAGDKRFAVCAAMLRDRRMRTQRDFFEMPTSRSREIADERTPEVARKWGFRMNMGLQSFRDTFEKFAELYE